APPATRHAGSPASLRRFHRAHWFAYARRHSDSFIDARSAATVSLEMVRSNAGMNVGQVDSSVTSRSGDAAHSMKQVPPVSPTSAAVRPASTLERQYVDLRLPAVDTTHSCPFGRAA